MERLKELLIKHDWYFEFAEDHASWLKGSQERDEIVKEAKKQGLSQDDMISFACGMCSTLEVINQWKNLKWENIK